PPVSATVATLLPVLLYLIPIAPASVTLVGLASLKLESPSPLITNLFPFLNPCSTANCTFALLLVRVRFTVGISITPSAQIFFVGQIVALLIRIATSSSTGPAQTTPATVP